MLTKIIFIDYKENGAPTDANEVVLASSDNTYGVKELIGGSVIVPNDTMVNNPSLGRYEYSVTLEDDKVYLVSWRVQSIPAGPYKYAVQQIGPFNSSSIYNSSTDARGIFAQNTTGTIFLQLFNLDGIATSAEAISVNIQDNVGNIVASGLPDILNTGIYAYDWVIPWDQAVGTYVATWTYTVEGQTSAEVQTIVVSGTDPYTTQSLYDPRLVDMRTSLEYMLGAIMHIPIYQDIPKPSRDRITFQFSKGNWNTSSGVRVYINNTIQSGGYNINFKTGTIVFDNPLTQYDNVRADYNFRWFTDEKIDRFLSNALHMLNLYPAVTGYNLYQIPDRFLGLIFYGAAVDAIREVLLSLTIQETQLIFGGPEAAKNVFSQLESLKKNYEETWMEGLKQKKYGPYKGLTKMIIVPEYTLPGGRSRWFRQLFSGST